MYCSGSRILSHVVVEPNKVGREEILMSKASYAWSAFWKATRLWLSLLSSLTDPRATIRGTIGLESIAG